MALHIAPILTMIFKRSYGTGIVPSIWKTANVCPVFKKGKLFEVMNYRPVSLTCICCKIMEHIVISHIMNHADKHNNLYKMQHGFRKKLSCETQLVHRRCHTESWQWTTNRLPHHGLLKGLWQSKPQPPNPQTWSIWTHKGKTNAWIKCTERCHWRGEVWHHKGRVWSS